MNVVWPGWTTTLAIALVSAFFTACVTEPVRAVIQRWVRRREVRRSLYGEILENWKAIDAQVEMAKQNAEMVAGIGVRFAMGFRKSSYEMAQRDPVIYYALRYRERYWMDILYRDAEHVITGKFNDDEQRLRNADFVAFEFLSVMKNRNLSRRMIYAATERQFRPYLTGRIAETNYADVSPVGAVERARRRFDKARDRFSLRKAI